MAGPGGSSGRPWTPRLIFRTSCPPRWPSRPLRGTSCGRDTARQRPSSRPPTPRTSTHGPPGRHGPTQSRPWAAFRDGGRGAFGPAGRAPAAGRSRCLGRAAPGPPTETGIHAIDAEARKLHVAAVGARFARRGPAPRRRSSYASRQPQPGASRQHARALRTSCAGTPTAVPSRAGIAIRGWKIDRLIPGNWPCSAVRCWDGCPWPGSGGDRG